MGYELTIKVDELDEKYKPFYSERPKREEIDNQLNGIVIYCMTFDKGDNDFAYMKFQKDISFQIRMYTSLLEQDWKFGLQERKKSEDGIYFCGWGYSHENYIDYDEAINNQVEDIVTIGYCVPTPDFFEDEQHFWDKISKIKDRLLEIEEMVYDKWSYMFVNQYRDKKKEDGVEVEESY